MDDRCGVIVLGPLNQDAARPVPDRCGCPQPLAYIYTFISRRVPFAASLQRGRLVFWARKLKIAAPGFHARRPLTTEERTSLTTGGNGHARRTIITAPLPSLPNAHTHAHRLASAATLCGRVSTLVVVTMVGVSKNVFEMSRSIPTCVLFSDRPSGNDVMGQAGSSLVAAVAGSH